MEESDLLNNFDLWERKKHDDWWFQGNSLPARKLNYIIRTGTRAFNLYFNFGFCDISGIFSLGLKMINSVFSCSFSRGFGGLGVVFRVLIRTNPKQKKETTGWPVKNTKIRWQARQLCVDEARAQLDEAESKQKARPMGKAHEKGGRFHVGLEMVRITRFFCLSFWALEKKYVVQMILMSILHDVDSCIW